MVEPSPLLCDDAPYTFSLSLEEVEPVPVLADDGIWWIGLSQVSYSNLLINLHRIKYQLAQELAVSSYYKSCINTYQAMP